MVAVVAPWKLLVDVDVVAECVPPRWCGIVAVDVCRARDFVAAFAGVVVEEAPVRARLGCGFRCGRVCCCCCGFWSCCRLLFLSLFWLLLAVAGEVSTGGCYCDSQEVFVLL